MTEIQPHIKIVHSISGHGLNKDAQILREILEDFGCRVDVDARNFQPKNNAIQRYWKTCLYKFNFIFFLKKWHAIRKCKNSPIFIHLENIRFDTLLEPGTHVLIPNQEWFKLSGIPLLRYLDVVWCKSILAQQVFSEYGVKTEIIGFSSQWADNNSRRHIEKKTAFVSRIGNSSLRGINELVNCWSKHPEWPELNIVVPASRRVFPSPINVIYVDEFDDAESYLNFSAQFQFQICASQTEGFGHSIFEAIDHGSVVLVTDGPPMNEWFSADNSILISSRYVGQHRLSPCFGVSEEGLNSAVQHALSLTEVEINLYRVNGFDLLLQVRKKFNIELKASLSRLVR